MDKQYRALKTVGRWAVGEIIGDLPQAQLSQLLNDRSIEAIKEIENPKSEVKPIPKKTSTGENSNG